MPGGTWLLSFVPNYNRGSLRVGLKPPSVRQNNIKQISSLRTTAVIAYHNGSWWRAGKDWMPAFVAHNAPEAMLDLRSSPAIQYVNSPGGVCRSFRKQKILLFLCLLTFLFGLYQVVRLPLKDPLSFIWTDQCMPKSTVAFLKTHKTAGTTVQNIFLRYADNHRLMLVLPRTKNYIGHPEIFQRHLVPRLKKNYSYDILCHHTRYNYGEIRRVLPGDPAFVTIVRDPVHLFESLFSYYQLSAKYDNMTLEEIAQADISMKALLNRRFYRRIGRNQMSFDLGLPEEWFDDSDHVLQFVQRLDAQFDLVMVAEHMDESLVLLRNLLCWDVEDMVTFRHNVRLANLRNDGLSKDVVRGLRFWNSADQVLYNHFVSRLEEKIDSFGRERMKKEVAELRAVTDHWYRLCVEDEVLSKLLENKFKSHSSKVLGFKLRSNSTDPTCENLAKAELPYTTELRQRQKPYYLRSESSFRQSQDA